MFHAITTKVILLGKMSNKLSQSISFSMCGGGVCAYMRTRDLDNLNLIWWFDFRLQPIYDIYPPAFKSGQK